MEIDIIKDFLIDRPLISISALERKVGIPATALSHVIGGSRTRLAKKHIEPLVNELKKYGYETKN